MKNPTTRCLRLKWRGKRVGHCCAAVESPLVGFPPLFPLGFQQDFNTLPSLQLLHAYELEQPAPPTAAPAVTTAAAATAAAATGSSPRGGDDDNASSQSCTPCSHGLDASWRTQASSGVSVSASASQPPERPSVAGAGGYAEEKEDGGGWSGSGAPSWNDDNRRRGAPVALRCASSRELQLLYCAGVLLCWNHTLVVFAPSVLTSSRDAAGGGPGRCCSWLMFFPGPVECRVKFSRS